MEVREAELEVSNSEKIVEQKEIESNLKAQQYQTLILRQQELDKNLADNKSEEERKELIQKKAELTARHEKIRLLHYHKAFLFDYRNALFCRF